MPANGIVWVSGLFSTGLRVNIDQLMEGVAVFAGPQVHVMMSLMSPTPTHPPASLTPWGLDLTSSTRLVPGVVLGAQFL